MVVLQVLANDVLMTLLNANFFNENLKYHFLSFFRSIYKLKSSI